MSTRYGKSPGGYLWAIIEPLGAIVVLGLGFSLLLRTPALGTSFILFFATGYLPFDLYQGVNTSVSKSLMFSRPLLAYPTVTWVDAVLARFILNAATGIVVFVIVVASVLTFTDSRSVLDIGEIVQAMCLALFLGLGVGVLNCALMGLFPVWENVWSIITRPLFFASGLFYLYEDMPSVVQDILYFNPLLHIVGIMRDGFYSTYSPQYISTMYVLSCGLVSLFFGVLLLYRYNRDIINN
ncbi:ABC transporter permease [Pseudooceanicola sp. LIPI14-2-Ac024]|uniref:ABC transporter permease n=1 Tax=Pseudooceanicola sp. LIPI14-2-Ac024 TaxID=3344875 RepID=UPI0035CF497F